MHGNGFPTQFHRPERHRHRSVIIIIKSLTRSRLYGDLNHIQIRCSQSYSNQTKHREGSNNICDSNYGLFPLYLCPASHYIRRTLPKPMQFKINRFNCYAIIFILLTIELCCTQKRWYRTALLGLRWLMHRIIMHSHNERFWSLQIYSPFRLARLRSASDDEFQYWSDQ